MLSSLFDIKEGSVAQQATLAGAFILVFAMAAAAMASGATLSVDERILSILRGASPSEAPLGGAIVTDLMRVISAFGTLEALLPMGLVGGFLLFRRGQNRHALVFLICVLGARVSGVFLKAGFGRARPEPAFHLAEVTSLSFPSGHALNSSATFLALALFLGAKASPRTRIIMILVAVDCTLLMGLSRVWLGVHWPSDVAAGWALGAAYALGGFAIANAISQNPGGPGKSDTAAPRPTIHK